MSTTLQERAARAQRLAEMRPIVDRLRGVHRVLVCSHESPEGDCLGSALALGRALELAGLQVVLFNPDVIPPQYAFLEGMERMVRQLPAIEFDVVFVVDCSTLERIGSAAGRISEHSCIINIDHHGSNTRFGHINVIDAGASSTGELIYELITLLELPIDTVIADALYAAIITDTGCFQYSNTASSTFQAALALMEAGLRPERVAVGLFENLPANRLRLLSRVLDTLDVAPHGQWASLLISQEMLTATGTTLADTEGFINYARSIRGVEVAILFKQKGPSYGVSLRGKGGIDVAAIASAFGGGGHRNAAAFALQGDLDDVRTRTILAVNAALGVLPR